MRATACGHGVMPILLVAVILGSAGVIAAQDPDRQQWLTDRAVHYGTENLDAVSGLIKDRTGRPSVAPGSPGFVVAALATETNHQQALAVLQAVLANQDQAGDSPTRGQFSWWTGPSATPTLRATYCVVPLLAYIHQRWGATVPAHVQEQLATSLNLSWQALRRRLRCGRAPAR